MTLSLGRTLAHDRLENPLPVSSTEHPHFHQHGDYPRHVHHHRHTDPDQVIAHDHSHLVNPPKRPLR